MAENRNRRGKYRANDKSGNIKGSVNGERRKVQNKSGSKQILIIIILLILGGGVAVFCGMDRISPEQEQAAALITSVEPEIRLIQVTDNMESNKNSLEKLYNLEQQLKTISNSFISEHRKASEFLKQIGQIKTELTRVNADMMAQFDIKKTYEEIEADLASGALSGQEALTRLDEYANRYPESEYSRKARDRHYELRSSAVKREKREHKELIRRIKSSLQQGRFSEALQGIEEAGAKEYIYLEQEKIDSELGSFREEVITKAKDDFNMFCRKAVLRAKTGSCDKAVQEINDRFREMRLGELSTVSRKAIAEIDTIRQKRIADARKKIRSDIEKIAAFEKKRLYENAQELYEKVLSGIEEPELKAETEHRKKMNDLSVIVKTAIISLVAVEKGVNLPGTGFIAEADSDNVKLEIDGTGMKLGWDTIQDPEYTRLMELVVLKGKNLSSEFYLACGINVKNEKAAQKYFSKAISIDKGISDRYPEVIGAFQERIAKLEAERKKKEAERLASIQEEIYNRRNKWRVMPIRLKKEHFEKKWIGGEALQHPHSIGRSLYNPKYIYASQDCAQMWISRNGGETWKKPKCKGMYNKIGQSIEADPYSPEVCFNIIAAGWNYLAADWEGLFRTRDGGETWNLVLKTKTGYNSSRHRIYRHNVTYDLASKSDRGALRWYVAFPGNGLYKTEDAGDNWEKVSDLSGFHTCYTLWAHPTDGKTVYLATNKGLYYSEEQGRNLKVLGNLPSGAVSSVQVNLKNPNLLYGTLHGKGLYKSTDAGKTWTEIKSFKAARVFVNPMHPDRLYLVGISSHTIISKNGGDSWQESRTHPVNESWRSTFRGELCGLVPDPSNPDSAVGYALSTFWKTDDNGLNWNESSSLFCGFAWSWYSDGIEFDRFNPDRFMTFNCDTGLVLTTNGGKWFSEPDDPKGQPRAWYEAGKVSWTGMYAGALQPVKDSQIIVATLGYYWKDKIIRSIDGGQTWELKTNKNYKKNLVVEFHLEKTDIVWCGNKMSKDAGATFTDIPFGQFKSMDPAFIGMCEAKPDTIYAVDMDNKNILRSDDAGDTWRLYNKPGWTMSALSRKPTFAVHPQNPDVLYALSSGRDLARYDGKGWRQCDIMKMIDAPDLGLYVSRVAVDPKMPNVVYAGIGGFGVPCVYRSQDDGNTWQDVTNNLPHCGVSAFKVNPNTGDLMLGSSYGTWVFPPPYKAQHSLWDNCIDQDDPRFPSHWN